MIARIVVLVAVAGTLAIVVNSALLPLRAIAAVLGGVAP